MFCMHTYPYYGVVSATGDVAIKKPKVRMMDFHGLSLRPLVVKGLKGGFVSTTDLSEYNQMSNLRINQSVTLRKIIEVIKTIT